MLCFALIGDSLFGSFIREHEPRVGAIPAAMVGTLSPRKQLGRSGGGQSTMAKVQARRAQHEPMEIYEDEPEGYETADETEAMEESRDPLTESGCTRSEESEEEIEDSVLEDMEQFEQSFKGITKMYRLINRIGEGERRVC